jgi:hypothetical protein
MGHVRGDHALSPELGPALGRGMGMAATEKLTSHLPGAGTASDHSGHEPAAVSGAPDQPSAQDQQSQGHHAHGLPAAPDAKKVPGYPQDMWMTMDEVVESPETYGMAKGWTGSMMGMMTVVRVLEGAFYDEVTRRVREAAAVAKPAGKPPA